MTVTVVSEKEQRTFDASHVECLTPQGNLTVLPDHEPALYAIRQNSVVQIHPSREDEEVHAITVQTAVIKIARDRVTVVLF